MCFVLPPWKPPGETNTSLFFWLSMLYCVLMHDCPQVIMHESSTTSPLQRSVKLNTLWRSLDLVNQSLYPIQFSWSHHSIIPHNIWVCVPTRKAKNCQIIYRSNFGIFGISIIVLFFIWKKNTVYPNFGLSFSKYCKKYHFLVGQL